MGSPRTLNVHCPWTEVLDRVETPTQARVLPARVRCPLCGGARLTIYEDTISGGGWHYCFDCHSSGDMIELAAAAWKVSPQVAVRRLADSGLPFPADRITADAVNTYVAAYPQTRNRINAFHQKASEYFITQQDPLLTTFREKFRIASQLSPKRWREGPGHMVGAYPHLGVERVFLPKSVYGGRAVSDTRTFRGRGWSTVMAVPHYDLPGRICGFLLVGRNCGPDDRVFRTPQMRPGQAGQPPHEGGLGCYWAVENSFGMFGDKVVAVGDDFLALRLHVRHFAVSRTPLPLVSYLDMPRGGLTQKAWKSLDTKKPVLWGWRLTPSLLFQAVASAGHLSITELVDTSQGRVDHFIRNAEPRVIVQRVIKESMPWQDYVRKWSERVEDGVIENLLIGLETYGVDMKVMAEVGGRFGQMVRVRPRVNTVTFGSFTVSESEGQTWLSKKSKPAELLMNAILRVDGTSLRQSGGDGEPIAMYKCRLLYKDIEVPFERSIKYVHEHFQSMLEAELVKKCPGASLYIAPGWRRRLISAAKQLTENLA